MTDDFELLGLERQLVHLSATAKRWWMIGVVLGLMGVVALYQTFSRETGSPLPGAVLLALAVGVTLNGYYWSRVGRYLELRGTVADRGFEG